MSNPMSEQRQKLADRYEKSTGKKFGARTNADRIRSMSDEELSVLIAKEIVHVPLSGFYVAKSAWLRWLQETVDEVEHES